MNLKNEGMDKLSIQYCNQLFDILVCQIGYVYLDWLYTA